MKAQATSNEAVIEFTGRVQRMVRVHQYELRDRPSRGSTEVQYESRPLIGISELDVSIVEQLIINALT